MAEPEPPEAAWGPPSPQQRAEQIRQHIAALRKVQAYCRSLGVQHDCSALHAFSGLISGYADLVEHALGRGVDYQYGEGVLGRPVHKAIYLGEKLQQLLGPWCASEEFRAHLLAMFLHGKRKPDEAPP